MKRTICWLSLVAFAAGLSLLATDARANIYLDEDFEGDPIFVDRGWPVRSADDVPTPASVALMGTNLRVGGVSGDPPAQITPSVSVTNTGGTVTSSRFFRGSKSMQLNNQSMSVGPNNFPDGTKGSRLFRALQCAVSVGPDALTQTDGTVVGRIQQNWSTNDNLGTVDFSLVLNLVKNDAENRIDLICANNDDLLGSLSGDLGDWLVVTIINNIGTTGETYEVEDTVFIEHLDTFTNELKAPEQVLPTGIHVFANSMTPVSTLTYAEINAAQTGGASARWGNSNIDGDQTAEMGWEIASLVDADVFIDNLYWDSGYHQDPNGQLTEQAARMTAFDDAGTELEGPPPNRSQKWEIFD